jgi:hypothetical protein
MPVLKHISPPAVPFAPKDFPLKSVPSSSNKKALDIVLVEAIYKKQIGQK